MRKILLILILATLLLPQAHAQASITIYRDESHGQYYTHDTFSTLFKALQDAGVSVQVISNNFLETVKNAPKGSVIVIPNPEHGNFTEDEINALKSFVEQGGILILMSEVQYSTSSGPRKYGRPGLLNNIVFSINASAPVWFEGDDENGNEIYDDQNNNGRPRQIKVSTDCISPLLRSGIEGDLVITTSMLHVSDPRYSLAVTKETAYAKSVNGNIIARGNIPRLAYFDSGEGKVILSGSTQAFTDRMISYSAYTKVLFINLLSRSTGVKLSVKTLKTTIPILDLIMIRLSMSVVALYDARYSTLEDKRERMNAVIKESAKYSFIIASLFAILSMIEAYMMNAVFITTAYPGRSQPTSLENVPLWANAFAKYFFAMLVDASIGIILGIIALRVEKLRAILIKYREKLKLL